MRILFSFLILVFVPVSSLFAECNTGSMTGTDFMLGLDCLDPLAQSRENGSSVPGGKDALLLLLGNISDVLLFTMPIIAAISIMIAGYFYIFSAGDSEKTGRAKVIIKWNIVALLVAFFSWSLVQIIALLFT